MIKIIIGLLIPPLIDLVNAKIKNSPVRFLVSFSICAFFGAVAYAGTLSVIGWHAFAIDPLLESILSIFGMSQLSYHGIYNGGAMQQSIRTTLAPNDPQIVTEEVTEHTVVLPRTTAVTTATTALHTTFVSDTPDGGTNTANQNQ